MPSVHFHTIHRNPPSNPDTPLALAIGNLEGVHLGHAALLRATCEQAKTSGYRAAALTFAPHPRAYFNPQSEPLQLHRMAGKIALLQQHGMATVFVARFNQRLASVTAEEFIVDFCKHTLNVRYIVTGSNFRFGKGRAGNAELLTNLARQHGLGYRGVEPVCTEQDGAISSTRIRDLLKTGNVQGASHLLGRPYSLCGRVLHGEKRGRQLGFPTANMRMASLFLPACGVYAVRARIDGRAYDGVANLGFRPTFEGQAPMLETHLFDMQDTLYGKRMEVALLHYLRPERRFGDSQSMIDQLNQDVLQARQWLIATNQSPPTTND